MPGLLQGIRYQLMLRILLISIICVVVAGCASAPPERSTTATASAEARAHQAQLANLKAWQLDGQIAVFERMIDERHAVYLRWQHQPSATQLRFSHPLKGTLATLTADASGAVLQRDGEAPLWASDITTLLEQRLNLPLPVKLLQQTVIGALPVSSQQIRYLADGTVADFMVTADQQQWQVKFLAYQAVQLNEQNLVLPHQVELISDQYLVRLRISTWTPLN
ncbi:MAG: lipoprotein insertase outer membrane protein LolB [Idiomarina sp.]